MLSLADIEKARDAIRDRVVETPCLRSVRLSELTGAEVFLKYENRQFTGSFKDRGALVKLLSLDAAQRRAGVVAMSAGNHAQSVAHQAGPLGIPATIVMPLTTPDVKVERTRALGAEVVLHGAGVEEAGVRALEIAEERGLTLVHPYDDVHVMAGQGTIALEMLEAVPDLEVLLVPIGGGGLAAGMAVAARALRPELEVRGVETARYPTMHQALSGEAIVTGHSTVADGIAVKQPGERTRRLLREHLAGIELVEERTIEQALLLLLETEKTLVEGAGAVPLAALLDGAAAFTGRRVGLVLSGGNIDLLTLAGVIQRGLARSARLVQLRVAAREQASELAVIAGVIAETRAQIEAANVSGAAALPVETGHIELLLKTRGPSHVHEIQQALAQRGFRSVVLDPMPVGRTPGVG